MKAVSAFLSLLNVGAAIVDDGNLSIIANGTDGQVLTMASGVPTWVDRSVKGGPNVSPRSKYDDSDKPPVVRPEHAPDTYRGERQGLTVEDAITLLRESRPDTANGLSGWAKNIGQLGAVGIIGVALLRLIDTGADGTKAAQEVVIELRTIREDTAKRDRAFTEALTDTRKEMGRINDLSIETRKVLGLLVDSLREKEPRQ